MVLLTTLFFAAITGTIATEFAQLVPQDFSKRSVNGGGGWALSESGCPVDAPQCGSSWCCPNSLTCIETGSSGIAEACCPGTTQCIDAIQSAPFCADDSWGLFNATLADDDDSEYFCCLPGQKGTQDGSCVSDETVLVASNSAELVIPGAGAATTSTPQTANTASITSHPAITTTESSVNTATTTSHGGIGGLISAGESYASAIHSALGSDAAPSVHVKALCFIGPIAGAFIAMLL